MGSHGKKGKMENSGIAVKGREYPLTLWYGMAWNRLPWAGIFFTHGEYSHAQKMQKNRH